MSEAISWDETEESTSQKVATAPITATDLGQAQENANLSKEQMKELVRKAKEEKPNDLIQPLILKGVTASANRFYILRAITMQDMAEVEDLMATFEEQQLKTARTSAKQEWLRNRKKEGKTADENSLTEDQKAELKAYIDDFVKKSIPHIAKRVNELVVNVVGVVFPKTHAKKVSSGNIPYGDVVMVSSAVQVFSGWSEVEMDIEAYTDQDLDEAYQDIE